MKSERYASARFDPGNCFLQGKVTSAGKLLLFLLMVVLAVTAPACLAAKEVEGRSSKAIPATKFTTASVILDGIFCSGYVG
jgi:hypothetical protein